MDESHVDEIDDGLDDSKGYMERLANAKEENERNMRALEKLYREKLNQRGLWLIRAMCNFFSIGLYLRYIGPCISKNI